MSEVTDAPAAGRTSDGGSLPDRADGVRLMGEMSGSGYRRPPALARRADGQTIQLTPMLYLLLEALDGRRDHDELAAAVSAATGRSVSAANVETLVGKLREMGLCTTVDGAQPEVQRSNPLLGLRFKAVVTDPERTRRLTTPFAALFNPVLVALVVAAFVWICWWVLFERGLAGATHDAFARPGLLLAVLAITVLSAGFHEFGHAAAARRGGAPPGAMGVGLYLIWPAFYTDVTDSYRLGRGGRLRTDLGGLYFNAIVAVVTVAAWWLTRDDAVLLLVAAQILQMLRQLLPLVRFDGYHVLADLTGVPDLFQRIGPTLRGLLPWNWRSPEAQVLKPWARAVVSAWVLTVVPVLAVTLVLLVTTFPRIVGTAAAAAAAQWAEFTTALDEGDLVSATARGLSALVVLLPVAAIAVVLVRVAHRLVTSVRTRTEGRPARRAVAAVAAVALVGGLAWAWWPSSERYRPIQAYERGTLADAVALAGPSTGFDVGSTGQGTIAWPAGTDLPTRERPQLGMVLVPRDTGSAPAGTAADSPAPQTWIFPFSEPPAPGEGDTQALAVNTTDGTAVYDVAFGLIWADGSEPATNTNEAYALASCTGCAAVAVSFQVVLVVGQTDVAVPQNISVAVNSDCVNCLTFALAVQLFVTLDGPLSAEATARIERIWQDVVAYGENIGEVPLADIQAQLTAFEQQILAVVEEEQGPLGGAGPSGSPTPTASGSASPSPSATDAASPSAGPSGTTSASPTARPTAGPSSSPSPSPSPSPSSSATPTPSPTASPTGTP
ncbi:hypothetical protein [uncultured Phycicoccus sp.]|uniref:hypothetical protein n=1 Tax=uncultured Phycicoccus sp. TaxID=661422 RepID=UPI002627995B|nr:hypothetical protein [uncultured Phycicoccus sp.]